MTKPTDLVPAGLAGLGGDDPPASPHHQLPTEHLEVLQVYDDEIRVDPQVVLAALDRSGPRGLLTRRPLSGGVKITAARTMTLTRVTYAAFCEKRHFEQVVRPHRGEEPCSDSLPPLWRDPPEHRDKPAKQSIPIRAEESVAPCHECQGQGTQPCPACSGQGRRTCGSCKGSGKRGEATDLKSCSSCAGEGTLACRRCKSTGSRTCKTCEGCGDLFRTHELVREHYAHQSVDAIGGQQDWNSHSWIAQAEGDFLLDVVLPGRAVLEGGHGPVVEMTRRVIDRHNDKLDQDEGFTFWTRLTLTQVDVIQAHYKVGRRSSTHVLHVFGQQQAVAMPGPRPWGCGCFSLGSPVVLAAVFLAFMLMNWTP